MKKSSQVLSYVTIGIFLTVVITSLAFRSFNVSDKNQNFAFFSSHVIVGNGKIASTSTPVDDFDTINSSGKFDITIQNSNKNRLTLTTDENLIPTIKISTINHVLGIQSNQDSSGRPKIVIATEQLKQLNMSGKSELHAENLNSGHLTINMNGKSTGYIQGETKSMDLILNGKSELHATLPHADRISVSVNGKGTVYLSGKVKNLTILSRGKAYIDAKNLVADAVVVQSAGESNMTIHAVKTLTVQAFGKSDIQYDGDPQITKNIFGEATLTKISKQ